MIYYVLVFITLFNNNLESEIVEVYKDKASCIEEKIVMLDMLKNPPINYHLICLTRDASLEVPQ